MKIHRTLLLIIAFWLLVLLLPNPSIAEWTIEAIDMPKYLTNFSQRAIALDSNNHPHIVYGGGHLYYAYYDGAQWQYGTVDSSSGVGIYASIAIDSQDKVHISYYDWTNEDLKYATNASGSWVIYTVDSAEQVGLDTSIAIDSLDKVHISYLDSTNGDLKYATGTDKFQLTVDKTGSGNGTVTSDATGITCGDDCTEDFAHGAVVTLSATPEADSTFTGWSRCMQWHRRMSGNYGWGKNGYCFV